ncbi:HAD family hydrolase [Roseomonas marmotae]|uniref:phosphoglycolate phosphatase n=1 Tax=Roseomonas marmotae TaxID=2768161 RepID=A0ABS3KCY3_9PROT|nr:HAD-IA family hydrolase [Roseomonas marmotae]MBO1075285.1 HAD-IA family hydrolase [Roseomonas marmotae]QTI78267.1 HAD-IA family hydrolase [Roseomonas marmotae]
MSLPGPRAILWDWDNTLVDAWAGVQAGMNAALRAFSMPEWSVEEVRARARLSLRESFPSLFGDEWERARDIFYAEVRARHLELITPMPGIPAALAAAAAWPQGIVSNKQGPILRAEATHLGWASRFGALVGAGDAEADKPSAAPVILALKMLGIAPGPEVWFIGDTGVDMQAARMAGCSAVLLGDAGHDGGMAAAAPDLAFANGHVLAERLLGLAKTPHFA